MIWVTLRDKLTTENTNMKNIHLHHADNLEIMAILPDESIDIICIDPPYLYLKNQKLERAFDEPKFFGECKRLLTKNGFIIMFGRGESFYRWNTLLAGLGFTFKEEVIWNKRRNSIPAAPLHRIHETISISTKNDGKLNVQKIPYLERKQFDIPSIIQDIKRISSALNSKEFDDVKKYLETGEITFTEKKYKNFFNNSFSDRSRASATCRTIIEGMREKSIIEQIGDHFKHIHPTQKPVRLLERLLNLTIPKDKKEIAVADFFAGSGSTMEAVLNLQKENPDKTFKGIATEIDQEYFDGMKGRIENYSTNVRDIKKKPQKSEPINLFTQ